MNIKQIKKGKFERYSFKDLEYGLKLLYIRLTKIDKAIAMMNEIFNEHLDKRNSAWNKMNIDITAKKEKESIKKAIEKCEIEISERLLTGNDDGVMERELLGQPT